FKNINHWNQAIHLEMEKTVTFSIIKKAMKEVMKNHPTLQIRFMKEENDHWVQQYMNDGNSLKVVNVKDNNYEEKNTESNLFSLAQKFQGNLDITDGPTVLAVLVEN